MKKTVLILFILMLAALPFDPMLAGLCHGSSPLLRDVFGFITHFGESQYILIPAAIVLFFCWKRPRLEKPFIISMHVFSIVATAGILVQIPKYVFGRARPYLFWETGDRGLHWFTGGADFTSFPSGHATTAAALAFALMPFFPRARLPLALYAALVAISRMVLEKHYMSDVLGGAFIASLVAFYLAKRLPMRV